MTRPIPFNDLARINDPLRDEISAALTETMDSGMYLRGHQVELFEEEWAARCGQRFAVACNSGTDALTLAAIALGMDTAAVPANTLPLTAVGLANAGTRVRVREISADGHLDEVSPDSVPVLLFGREPSHDEQGSRLFDAAHAHGWQPPRGSTAAWSFYPTKSLGALGDAGAVTTDDEEAAALMRALRGSDDRLHDRRQLTTRMDAFQAAVLRVKLRRLDSWLDDRRRVADRYDIQLGHLRGATAGRSLHHLYVIQVSDRSVAVDALRREGISTKIHWPQSLDILDGPWTAPDPSYERSKAWSDTVLSLPCYPGLRDAEIDTVASVLLTAIGE